jgi:hypothetical protein
MPPEPPRTEAIVYGNGHDKDVSVHSIVIKAKTIAISVPISFRREASVHDDGKDDSVDPIVASLRIHVSCAQSCNFHHYYTISG